MAMKLAKFTDNVSGKYYVDENCIACDACVMEAPGFFTMNDDDGHAYVKNQPQSAKEIAECEEALTGCPVDSIGNDGHF